MNTVLKTLLITGLLFIAVSASAWAGRIEDRQDKQLHRINHGASSGRLTKFETRELMLEQQDIKRQIQNARSDGIITCIERRQLKCVQDRASQHIRRLMFNRFVYRPNSFERGHAPTATQRRRS